MIMTIDTSREAQNIELFRHFLSLFFVFFFSSFLKFLLFSVPSFPPPLCSAHSGERKGEWKRRREGREEEETERMKVLRAVRIRSSVLLSNYSFFSSRSVSFSQFCSSHSSAMSSSSSTPSKAAATNGKLTKAQLAAQAAEFHRVHAAARAAAGGAKPLPTAAAGGIDPVEQTLKK